MDELGITTASKFNTDTYDIPHLTMMSFDDPPKKAEVLFDLPMAQSFDAFHPADATRIKWKVRP